MLQRQPTELKTEVTQEGEAQGVANVIWTVESRDMRSTPLSVPICTTACGFCVLRVPQL